MDYLSIRNWREYQHYKDRRPPWVKLHVRILEDDSFRALTPLSRLVALLLLAVAANKDNRIPNDSSWLSVELGLPRKVIAAALDDLLADCYLICTENAMPRDRDRERDRTTSSSSVYVLPEFALKKLLKALSDKDDDTEAVLVGLGYRHKLPEAAFGYALDCAEGPGVVSPTAVAVSELKKWRRAA